MRVGFTAEDFRLQHRLMQPTKLSVAKSDCGVQSLCFNGFHFCLTMVCCRFILIGCVNQLGKSVKSIIWNAGWFFCFLWYKGSVILFSCACGEDQPTQPFSVPNLSASRPKNFGQSIGKESKNDASKANDKCKRPTKRNLDKPSRKGRGVLQWLPVC